MPGAWKGHVISFSIHHKSCSVTQADDGYSKDPTCLTLFLGRSSAVSFLPQLELVSAALVTWSR